VLQNQWRNLKSTGISGVLTGWAIHTEPVRANSRIPDFDRAITIVKNTSREDRCFEFPSLSAVFFPGVSACSKSAGPGKELWYSHKQDTGEDSHHRQPEYIKNAGNKICIDKSRGC
jgi:hypothetical protein